MENWKQGAQFIDNLSTIYRQFKLIDGLSTLYRRFIDALSTLYRQFVARLAADPRDRNSRSSVAKGRRNEPSKAKAYTRVCTSSQQQHELRPNSIGHQASGGIGGIEARQSQASTLKLTRGRSAAARYLQTTTTTTTTTHYQQPAPVGFAGLPTLPGHTAPRIPRHGVRPATRHHFGPRGSFSNETQEEVQEEDEATLRELLLR
jgi:hypothetical protein